MCFFRYYVRMRRNLKQFITILVLLMGTLKAVADDFTLKGKVVDEEEHALELVTVSCPAQGKVTMTNLKGEFSLHLQSADSIEVRFSMVGFATRKRVFRNPKKQLRVQIVMHPMKALQEVTVTQQRRQTGQTQELNVKDLKQTPSTTGNAVEELIQQQAGVSTHNELSSQYNVRGGSFDENLVYINQVEVYRPMLVSSGQQEGLSIINPDMVEKIGFSTGGFEAKYGDKMSSALDITYRRVEGFEATASASLLGASGYLGVGNKRFSMLHGLRYKTNKYLLGSLETNGEYQPNFLDYQTYDGLHHSTLSAQQGISIADTLVFTFMQIALGKGTYIKQTEERNDSEDDNLVVGTTTNSSHNRCRHSTDSETNNKEIARCQFKNQADEGYCSPHLPEMLHDIIKHNQLIVYYFLLIYDV